MKFIKIILAIIFVLIVIFLIGNMGSYKIYNKPIEGRAVDKDTGEPIEGACVVVVLQRMGIEGGHTGLVNIKETQTDKNGYFKITKWGPRHIFNYFFIQQYPSVTIFKPGYKVWWMVDLGATDGLYMGGERGRIRTEVYKTKIFKMEKFEGSLEDWAEEIHWAASGIKIRWIIDFDWGKKVKNMVKILKKECETIIYKSREEIKPRCWNRLKKVSLPDELER